MDSFISQVPWWVFIVFGFGVFKGIQALSERQVSLKSAPLLPLVFIVLSIPTLVSVGGENPLVVVVYLTAAGLGLVSGWYFFSQTPREVDQEKMLLKVPGSPLVLVLFLLVFSVKFAYQSLLATHSLQSGHLFLIFAASGLSTGIVTGRMMKMFADFAEFSRK